MSIKYALKNLRMKTFHEICSNKRMPWAHSWLMPLDNDDVEQMTEETTLTFIVIDIGPKSAT